MEKEDKYNIEDFDISSSRNIQFLNHPFPLRIDNETKWTYLR